MAEPSSTPLADTGAEAPPAAGDLWGAVALPVLLAACFLYYLAFAASLDAYSENSGLWQLALNFHDHVVYVNGIDRIRDGDIQLVLSNDVGIAAIYTALSALFPFLADPSYALLALLFNCAVLWACYRMYADICQELGLGTGGKLSFFANTSVIYFAQLINKDMLTILVFLWAARAGLRRRLLPVVMALPLLALVRLQVVVFAAIFVHLVRSQRPGRSIAWLYLATSLAGGLISVFAGLIGSESLGEGLSAFLVEFNQKYYVGYLLFNPLRVVQYLFDALASFAFWTPTGGVDAAKVLRLPQLLLLLALWRPLSTLVTRFRFWLEAPVRPLVLAVVAYLLAWLMNPTVNARYAMLITPVLVLFALHARDLARRSAA